MENERPAVTSEISFTNRGCVSGNNGYLFPDTPLTVRKEEIAGSVTAVVSQAVTIKTWVPDDTDLADFGPGLSVISQVFPAVTNDFLFHPLQRMEGKGNHGPGCGFLISNTNNWFQCILEPIIFCITNEIPFIR